MFDKKFKICLSLGGGGARGLAHLGVLRTLDKEKFPIDLITGSSMGAIIGAAYCIYKDVDYIEEKIKIIISTDEIKKLMLFTADTEFNKKKLLIGKFINFINEIYTWNVKRTKKWLFESDILINLIKTLIPEDIDFSKTKIPFACVATDLFKGESVLLKKGNILKSVLASSSIPGIFPPVKIDGRFLVDGGILSLVPVNEARSFGADFVIGIDVEGSSRRENIKNGLDVLFQIDYIRSHWINKINTAKCDFLINPQVSGMNWADFSLADHCILKGENAISKCLPELKQKARKSKYKTYFKKILP